MPRVYTSNAIDMTGQVYGRLRVVRHAGHTASGVALWECLCDPELGGCGNPHVTSRRNLLHKISPTRSCGCLRVEKSRGRALERIRSNNQPEEQDVAQQQ